MKKGLEKFRNKLLICEGQDFCGKSTVAKMLVKHLNKHNVPAVYTFQPGDPAYGTNATLFRSLCKDKRHNLHPLTNFFIFFADKVEQVHKVIIPALKSGKAVVSDRWWHSTYAYQLFGKQIAKEYDISEETINWLNLNSTLNIVPDIVFYFHQSIKKHNREEDKNDMFDSAAKEFKQRVKNGYEELFLHHSNIIKIDTGNTAEETLEYILNSDIKIIS